MEDLSPSRESLEPIERSSLDELRSLQLVRLRSTVERVYEKVPFYREQFDRIGLHPSDITSLEDIRLLPFTAKSDLRTHYPLGLLAVPRAQLSRIHASSGTTGRPTVVGYTATDISTWADLMARSIRAAGGRPGDLVHVAYGYGLFTGGLGAHYGAERLGCTVVPASGGLTERQVTLIRDLRADVIMLTPSYMLVILDEFARQGIDPRETSLRVGIFGAEPWTAEMRAEIEIRADMHAVDIYGLSELMGPGVAQECVETKDGLTIWEDHFYPEVVDPATGEPLPDGQIGELVITSLTKEAMPLLRYRTRDLTRLLPGTARTMRRMERIRGRTDDMMIVRGVNVFPSQIEEIVLKTPGLSPHFLCVLSRPRRMDEMTVRVEAVPGAASAESRDRLRDELIARVKHGVGVTVDADVVEPGSLERSLGKAKRILDLRS
ncbi:MAG: phenylacetate--CoA ligase PaaK [Candidatus Dormibacteria bacterium]